MSTTVTVRRLAVGLAFATALSGPGCTTVSTTKPGAVGVEREQMMLLPADQIRTAAEQAYQEVLSKARSEGKLNQDSAQVQRVRAISQRLIAQTGTFNPDALQWNWEENVITSDEVNAWCMPGGKIAVYTGLLEQLQPSDAELAAILGHEMAHALRQHGRERASRQAATGLALSTAGAVLGVNQTEFNLAQIVANVTLTLPNTRTQEAEADRIGVELAARAGFDPMAAVSLWQKMSALGGSRPSEFLSTHPSPEHRIEDVRKYAQRVMPLYREASDSAA